MRNVKIIMLDLLTDKKVEREVSDSMLYVPNVDAVLDNEHDVLGTKEQQRKAINNWISERANDQHDSLLKLISWEII